MELRTTAQRATCNLILDSAEINEQKHIYRVECNLTVQSGVQTVKLVLCYSMTLRSKYYPLHFVLRHPQSVFFAQRQRHNYIKLKLYVHFTYQMVSQLWFLQAFNLLRHTHVPGAVYVFPFRAV